LGSLWNRLVLGRLCSNRTRANRRAQEHQPRDRPKQSTGIPKCTPHAGAPFLSANGRRRAARTARRGCQRGLRRRGRWQAEVQRSFPNSTASQIVARCLIARAMGARSNRSVVSRPNGQRCADIFISRQVCQSAWRPAIRFPERRDRESRLKPVKCGHGAARRWCAGDKRVCESRRGDEIVGSWVLRIRRRTCIFSA
jgi:hypothetical protein